MIGNGLKAPAYATDQECDKSHYVAEHASMKVSLSTGHLSNGLLHCSVHTDCGARFEWIIQTFGREAAELERRAAHSTFSDPKRTISNSEIATMLHQNNATSKFLNGNPVPKIAGLPVKIQGPASSNLNIY
jgi:hypothetical protein